MSGQVIVIDGKRIFVDKIVSYAKLDNKTRICMVNFDAIDSEKLEPEALDSIVGEQYIINDFDVMESEEDDENFLDDSI